MHSVNQIHDATADADWPLSEMRSLSDSSLTQVYENIAKPEDTTLDVLKVNSEKFPLKFPVQTVRCSNLSSDSMLLTSHINSTYPLIHERVLLIIENFLVHKAQNGSAVEKKLYKNMTLIDFIQRLLEKRAVCFFGANDRYQLLNQTKMAAGGWDEVGTDSETPPLLLKDCLSYDEMKISAFLSVSSYSEFINSGSRNNSGKLPNNKNEVQNNGIIIGLIGPRLKRASVMDYQEIVINAKQNVDTNGYGDDRKDRSPKKLFRDIWSSFFEEPNYSYSKAMKQYDHECSSNGGSRFTLIKNMLFDNVYYRKRLSISFDTLLIEANSRAKAAKTFAFIHVVGIGLGVWRIADHQEEVFIETFSQRLNYLLPRLENVSDIVFAYFNKTICGSIGSGQKMECKEHPLGGVKIEFSLRDPHARLTGSDLNKLLVVSYAWDSNALPGNEFWCGKLTSSGDPAAACSTQISELHNTHINNTKVSGRNLHVASIKHGVLHIKDYVQTVSTNRLKID